MSATTQRPTPETDAAIRKTWPADAAALAIKLERERDEARTQADNFAKRLEAMREAIREAHEVIEDADGSSYHIRGDACLTREASEKRKAALAKLQPFLKP